MRRALQHILTAQFPTKSTNRSFGLPPSKEVLDFIVESSNGDIRSAIMALQFATMSTSTTLDSQLKNKGKGKARKSAPSRALMEVVTRREQSLALFHLIGKLLYNKRMKAFSSITVCLVCWHPITGKGDPPSSSASAKDKQRDRDFDARLRDPPKLPPHLQHHDRKPSRVDVEVDPCSISTWNLTESEPFVRSYMRIRRSTLGCYPCTCIKIIHNIAMISISAAMWLTGLVGLTWAKTTLSVWF